MTCCCRVDLPVEASPVTHTLGRQRSAPAIGAMTIQPSSNSASIWPRLDGAGRIDVVIDDAGLGRVELAVGAGGQKLVAAVKDQVAVIVLPAAGTTHAAVGIEHAAVAAFGDQGARQPVAIDADDIAELAEPGEIGLRPLLRLVALE